MGAVDDIVGVLPAVFVGKVALDFTNSAFKTKTKRKATKRKSNPRKRKR